MNSPKKKAIIHAYPLFSHAQSKIPGGDAKPKNGAGSNCIKVQIINANLAPSGPAVDHSLASAVICVSISYEISFEMFLKKY